MTVTNAASSLTFDQLAELREKTEQLSQLLSSRLKTHLTTLYPILAPKRVFGKYLGIKEVISRDDEAYTQLAEKYREASGAPFDLRSDLDDEALSSMEHGIEVYPWEYTLQAKDKTVTISSPVRWVITYRSDYTLAEMRRLAATKGERRKPAIRHFVVPAAGRADPGGYPLFRRSGVHRVSGYRGRAPARRSVAAAGRENFHGLRKYPETLRHFKTQLSRRRKRTWAQVVAVRRTAGAM